MEIDFHHTAVYVLCRLAGMRSVYAEKVAYASQQVDNANYNHAMKFENGGIFHQTRTAHEGLAFLEMIDVNDAFNVWLPFHFIPSGEGNDPIEVLITRPESKSIKLLKNYVLEAGKEEYGLHYLGIFFHIYADAFSHQDFIGFYDQYNQIELVKGMDKMSWKDYIVFKITKHLGFLFPIGHAVAAKNPDIPYVVWTYRRGDKEITVDNLNQRFIPAVYSIYDYLQVYLDKNPQYGRSSERGLSRENMDLIIDLLKVTGSYQKRHQNWLEAIHNNAFGFKDFDDIDRELSYDKRSWFREAVVAVKAKGILQLLKYAAYNYYKFKKRDSFYRADWTLFMRAAAIHKYKLLHEILPACGIHVG
ncbi:MAG TPA: DUF6765 family protein [Halanaerobiales bacterium]|nr:DUF6765 family protein [Halanaerobiales bacterium]